jgi:hypothetical protein
MINTTILEEEIAKYQNMIADRDKQINFLKRQQKVDQNILKEMEKGLAQLKEQE